MQKIISSTVLCCLLLISAHTTFAYEKEIKALSVAMSEKVTKAGKKNIAVADFTDLQGGTTELGRFLAEELSSELADTAKGFELVDRNNLRSILTEHKFSMSGLVDPKTVKELGRIAGVDAIVTGTVTAFGDSVRVSAKVIATDTAKVIATARGDIAKTKAIEELLAKGIDTGAAPREQHADTTATKPTTKGHQQVEVKNFLFQLQKCKLSGQTIICDFLVTNKDNDRNLSIYATYSGGNPRSRIFDDMGNEFSADKVQMGNTLDSQVKHNNLVANVPMKAKLSFEGVTSQPNLLSLLEITCGRVGSSGLEVFSAQLRNVPLSNK